jgi:peptide-methionine (S)-S-oxide reductase
MRQGNDVGTHYSSIIVADEQQRPTAQASKAMYQEMLTKAGFGTITTDFVDAPPFYYAEEYHQQYLDKNPNGYCPDHGTGVACPVGLGVTSA